MKIIVIGGGAAGFFTAINIAEKRAEVSITILEKSNKLLQKVKVSGGGRCNVTNARSKPSELVPFYPRGHKKLHGLFKRFTTQDMETWLASHQVQLKTEADLRMFPVTDSSQTIIDCFLRLIKKHRIEVQTQQHWIDLQRKDQRWEVATKTDVYLADAVVLATGSSPTSWSILRKVGLQTTEIVPSLFTFNIKDARIQGLQGLSFPEASVKVVGTKLVESGPMLITHWGLSGPAILKLSSWGAYELHGRNYHFDVLINFIDAESEQVRNQIQQYKIEHPSRIVMKYPLFELPRRFWEQLLRFIGIGDTTPYGELSKKHLNKLVEELTQGKYPVTGKSTFKEEFVTAGGVRLTEINLDTYEAKRFPGLYLAGEVLDIDALTGGFNFQACWSAGWVISEHLKATSQISS